MKIHIGKEIERKFQQSGMKTTVFAERINTGERNVYTIFKREDIGLELLLTISKVLNYNFLELYNPTNAVNEPLEKYNSQKKLTTITLNLGFENNAIASFPDFMREVYVIAYKHDILIL